MSPGRHPPPEQHTTRQAEFREAELTRTLRQVTSTDDFYKYDAAQTKLLQKQAPWKSNPRYFTKVHMSALALVKIVMHAKTGKGKAGRISSDSGNWIEVMGMMQGVVMDNTLVVLDSFALPVQGDEVECSLTQESTEYLVTYLQYAEKVGKCEPVVGWYHSHPGYKCFLSKVDVTSQRRYQKYSDPFVAIVVDPVQTIATGRVEIKAFRTLPESMCEDPPPGGDLRATSAPAPEGEGDAGAGGAPSASKIEEYGVYASWYYEVPIEVFKSSADEEALTLLWSKFWSSTLSASPLTTNRFFIDRKVMALENQLRRAKAVMPTHKGAAAQAPLPLANETEAAAAASGSGSATAPRADRAAKDSKETTPLQDAKKASDDVCSEVLQGLIGVVAKDAAFNLRKH
eukprot:TRINITY_DN18677_c0_g2_i1.p1 TRINITY_DN18677_c0_g2~~TRINITY_DN18677_c0_g2_i1.p1  ORF type:complete len:400 (+),score=129.33 TRINITY_DN18677_c0_g2_i1:16-1215(+)